MFDTDIIRVTYKNGEIKMFDNVYRTKREGDDVVIYFKSSLRTGTKLKAIPINEVESVEIVGG